MIVFLAGPSVGYPERNRKAFDSVADTLRGKGLLVINPREVEEDFVDPREVFRAALRADSIVTMKGFETDPESALVVTLGKAVGTPIHRLEDMIGKTRP